MKIRHVHSHIPKTCVVCNAKSNSSKIYEEGGISIKVPVCDRDISDCHSKIIIKDLTKDMLRQLKHEIIKEVAI